MIRDLWPLATVALAAVGISLAVGAVHPEAPRPPVVRPPAPPAEDIAAAGPSAYDSALAELDRELAAHERLAAIDPPQWIRVERVANLYLARAQLTGDHADYLRAEEEMARAFSLAREDSGPFLSRAYLHYTLHRLALVEPDLVNVERAILVPAHVRDQAQALRADVAFHSGRYEEAERLHRELEERAPSATTAFSIAHDLWRTGRFAQAERMLALAAARSEREPRTHAFMELQRGALNRDLGRYDEALGFYRRADRLFSGHWLTALHVAEIYALRGDHQHAERLYRQLLGRRGDPEIMDALADVLEARGRADQAERMRARVRATYEEALARLPEATYGHALPHFLRHGSSERAIALARANEAERPGGEAGLLLVQALARGGELGEARARIEALLATPYRTAALHATAALIFRAGGEEERAREHEQRARAIRPDAIERLAWLEVGR